MPKKSGKPFRRVRQKEAVIGKNPKLSELIAWAEQNGFMVQIRLVDIQPKEIVQVVEDNSPSSAVTKDGQVVTE